MKKKCTKCGVEKELDQFSKRKNNPNFKIRNYLGIRIKKVLNGISKSDSTAKLLGCSIEFFIKYIELQFRSDMNWSNYGTRWDLDHNIPCIYFNLSDPEQQRICFNFRNLQPLYCFENRHVKNDKIPYGAAEYVAKIKSLIC
jgi:hypothetical protein